MTWETNKFGEQQGTFEFLYGETFKCPERGSLPYTKNFDHWRQDPCGLRTCSFCGSLNADDAIELIKDGGRMERTTKGYKYYIHHSTRRVGANKLYTWHVNHEQGVRLQALTVLR